MKKSSKKGKEMTQRSIISYVPKSKRGKHDVNDDLHSDDDSTDIIQENEEEYDSEIEIYEAQSSPEKKNNILKTITHMLDIRIIIQNINVMQLNSKMVLLINVCIKKEIHALIFRMNMSGLKLMMSK